jgi:hypothetical protein
VASAVACVSGELKSAGNVLTGGQRCRNTPLITSVTSTADELTSFVYSALLLGCGISVAEDNRGI